jgi:hypothetical protein
MDDTISAHLTQPNKELGAMISQTPSGMAHWAGSGPEFKTCRECAHFDHGNSYYSKTGMRGGCLKPAKCKKYRAMTQQNGGNIPRITRACKYFKQADVVPPVVSK